MNSTHLNLLAKLNSLEKELEIALREVEENDDLIKTQVDEFVTTTRRLLVEKSGLSKKLKEVEEIALEKDKIISSLSQGGSNEFVIKEKLIEASLPTSKEKGH